MPRTETYRIEDGALVRSVVPSRGDPYEHACDMHSFLGVTHRIDELDGGRFTYEQLVFLTGFPFSRVATAVAFLKERGCIVPARGRRHMAATSDVFLDAQIEWHALAEKGPDDAVPTSCAV